MSFFKGLVATGNFFQHILLLAIRLFWGVLFLLSGVGKYLHPNHTADFFQSIHIPFPLFSGYLTATFEILGGVALILGLGSRLMSLPLIIITCTALATAHKEDLAKVLHNPEHIISIAPFTFLMASLIIFAFGPGVVSIDAIIKRYKWK